jgi:hypothetical protein
MRPHSRQNAGTKIATLSVFHESILGVSAMAMAISKEMTIVLVLYARTFAELDDDFSTNC